MFHNFIFLPLKITRYWDSKKSNVKHLGISKICSCSKITGEKFHPDSVIALVVGFVIVGLDELCFYFSKIIGSYLWKEFPPCVRVGPPGVLWKPVVSTKLSLLWSWNFSISSALWDIAVFSHSALFYAMPSECAWCMWSVDWLATRWAFIQSFWFLVFFSVSFPSQNSNLNPSSFANPYRNFFLLLFLDWALFSWLTVW